MLCACKGATKRISSMSASCCGCGPKVSTQDPGLRRALWLVLTINAAMFAVEIGAGLAAGSASLQADALDFLGDAGNYAISLFVVGMALRYRAMAALAKAATMGVFGLWVIGITVWRRSRHASAGIHHGSGGVHGTYRQCWILCAAVGVPRRRLQYALSVDLHAERRARQSGSATGGARRLRNGHRLA